MANSTCTNMLRVVAIRASRLDDDGTILAGATSLYVPPAPILVGFTEVRQDRDRLSLTAGDGSKCADFVGSPNAVDSVDLRMDLCQYDAELLELLCGGQVVTDGGSYGTIGYKPPTEDNLNENGCFFETWAIQWNGRQRAKLGLAPAYYRHAFASTTWEKGEVVQENNFSTIPLTGVGEVNDSVDTGLSTDPLPEAFSGEPYYWFIDDAKPTAACGYQTIS